MHKERQEVRKRWYTEVMQVTALFVQRSLGCRSRVCFLFVLRSIVECGEDVVEAVLYQWRAGSVCMQLIFIYSDREALTSELLTSNTHQSILRADLRVVQRLRPEYFVHFSHHISEEAVTRPHLPKRCLADSRRAEDFCHLPAHISAREVMARKGWWREDLVELGDACRYSAGPAGVEVLEGLRRGYGRQSICHEVSVCEKATSTCMHTRRRREQCRVFSSHDVELVVAR